LHINIHHALRSTGICVAANALRPPKSDLKDVR
jgi:hypothetical protein